MLKVLILGVNGFIGHHLTRRIIETTDWQVYGMDMLSDRVAPWLDHPRFHFFEGDITINKEWIEYHVRKCDVVLPLVAIATPATYVLEPLRVFELDFEANLPIVRHCVKYRKRVVFPSTSEVYGMCDDESFDPENSSLVYGPINKPRWIYACAKQLLDRVIARLRAAAGSGATRCFDPSTGSGRGSTACTPPRKAASRVITQFLGHIVRGESIQLVDGGAQRRCFTDVSDGMDALVRILANHEGRANGNIYNIGNPENDLSVRELAQLMLEMAAQRPEYREHAARVQLRDTSSGDYYGRGYQDVQRRVPSIENTRRDLGWTPRVAMRQALERLFDHYQGELETARHLND